MKNCSVSELDLSFEIMTDSVIQISKHTRNPLSLAKGRVPLYPTFCYVILSST